MRLPSSLLAMACAASCGGDAGPSGPNVILVSIDTLRQDHVGCYGYERDTTPELDELAAEGVVFENHISSSSWTLPAHAALFTSVPDSVHGCMESTGTALSPAFTTLAERFDKAGYASAGFYAGPYLNEAFGLGQGFGTYRYCVDDEAGTYASERVEEWGLDPKAQLESHSGVTNPGVFAAGKSWLERNGDEPFFLFLHFWDVHYDFTPPAPWDTHFNPHYDGPVDGRNFFFDPSISADMPEADKEQLLALYDGEIRWTDTFLGKLRAELARLGLEDNTILAVTSDHGTEFFDHGGKGHRTTLYDELIRVPFVLWYPSGLEPRSVKAQTRIIDVGPTLLELCGLARPDGVLGHSLAGLARGEALDFDNRAISELYSVGSQLRSVRDLETKFLLNENVPDDPVRWFDLARDPKERTPLDDFETELGARAHGNYMSIRDALQTAIERRPGAPVDPDLSDEMRRQLEEAGYAGDEDE